MKQFPSYVHIADHPFCKQPRAQEFKKFALPAKKKLECRNAENYTNIAYEKESCGSIYANVKKYWSFYQYDANAPEAKKFFAACCGDGPPKNAPTVPPTTTYSPITTPPPKNTPSQKEWEYALYDCPVFAKYARPNCPYGPETCKKHPGDYLQDICKEFHSNGKCSSHYSIRQMLTNPCSGYQAPQPGSKGTHLGLYDWCTVTGRG